MARPRGFEPLTSASGVHRLGLVWSEVGGSKSFFVSNLQAGRKFTKSSFNTASYTIYAKFGHMLVRLEVARTGQNDRCPNCSGSQFNLSYTNVKLKKKRLVLIVQNWTTVEWSNPRALRYQALFCAQVS